MVDLFGNKLYDSFNTMLNGGKPSYSELHQQVYKLSNSQHTIDLANLHHEFITQTQKFIDCFLFTPFQKSLDDISELGHSLEETSNITSILLNQWTLIHDADHLIQKLLNGRKWYLETYSDTLVCASVYYKTQLLSLQNFPLLQRTISRVNELQGLFNFLEDKTNTNNYVGMLGNLQNKLTSPIPRHYFTRTKNVLVPLDFNFTPEMSQTDIFPKRIVMPFKQTAFVLENFLTPLECKHLIEQSEKVGYTSIETEFLKTSRDNKRILVISQNLAKEIFFRVLPFVRQIENIENKRPFGFNSKGSWEVCGVNECIRFCKYTAPSVGGDTNFMKLTTSGKMDETIEEEMKRGYTTEYRLVPKTGTAVIFEHNILHEGAPLLDGTKYIARTDIVFKRNNNPGDYSWKKDPNYLKMLEYYRIAGEEECKGRVDLSSEFYERALSIRQNFVEKN